MKNIHMEKTPNTQRRTPNADGTRFGIRSSKFNVQSFGLALVLSIGVASAADPAPSWTKTQLDFFEQKVRPVLESKCYKCHSHGAEKIKGGLVLDSREGAHQGGNTAPAVVPGNVAESLLIKAISYTDPDLEMPPKGEKLSDQQIADLTAWVKMGAPDPRESTAKAYGGAGKAHWAFQKPKLSEIPTVKEDAWVRTPIDSFILAKLEEKGMEPNPRADKRTLLRRAYFDLIGLPPTPEQVDAFVADESPDAFAKVVDELLASPRYGERWGRHWLDVARYSDTKGEVRRQQEDPRYPHAWTYRDYVIDAFNKDKPFDRFITEQIAADRLTLGTDKSALAAMGFLTLGNHFNGMAPDIVADRIDVVTKGFLGLTVTCARCHDHKFDPVSQKDYYALYGVFSSSYQPDNLPVLKPVKDTADYRDYVKQAGEFDVDPQEMRRKLQELRKDPDPKKRRELQREQQRQLRGATDLEMTHPGAPARANVLLDSAKPKDSPLFIRGEANNRGPVVPRSFIDILAGPNDPPYRNGSGRLELARDIASKDNPITARVLVNRVWQWHFGEGFVPTPDDLGNQSEKPSHPELLDYLAVKFMQQGWSLKKLHREIMLSATYQQSSAVNGKFAAIDPENRLLWRANLRRLDFEALRDSILAIAGTLDLTMGGKPVDLGAEPYVTRRAVYGYVDRRNLSEVMTQFDFANPDNPTGKRHVTIVPQQTLFMMNSPLVAEQARKLVGTDAFAAMSSEPDRVNELFRRIYQRPATDDEMALALRFVETTPARDAAPALAGNRRIPPQQLARMEARMKDPSVPMQQQQRIREQLRAEQTRNRAPLGAWEKLAQALFETNEASFIN